MGSCVPAGMESGVQPVTPQVSWEETETSYNSVVSHDTVSLRSRPGYRGNTAPFLL